MRNLILIRNFVAKDPALAVFRQCQIFTDCTSWKSAYLCFATVQGEVLLWETDNDRTFTQLCVLDVKEIDYINWSDDTLIVGLQLVNELLYVTLNYGFFIIISLANPSVDDTNGFNTRVNDITRVFWSGDSEKAVLLRKSSMISILDVPSEGEEIVDVLLQDVENESNRFISVGWGSTETQFRGSEGKLSKEAKEETTTVGAANDDSTLIAWKKDSSAFAVSYNCSRENRRKVKIFNRNGVLLNIAKDLEGLEAVTDWCPSRNLISHLQVLPNKNVICFLEENGLRHGEFQLPNDFKTERLLWNTDGTILATLGTEQANDLHTVLLWTTSNYKWYVKHKLQFEKRIVHLQWDDWLADRLHLVLENGFYRTYEWAFDVIESEEYIVQKYDRKIITTINGANVGITRYGDVFRPPSLPERVCYFPFYVNAIIFAKLTEKTSDFTPCDVLLYLSNNTLLHFNIESENESSTVISAENCYRFVLNVDKNKRAIRFSTPSEMTAWLWLPQRKNLYFCWTRTEGYYFCVSRLCPEARQCVIRETIKIDSRILIVTNHGGNVFVHLENGAVLIYSDEKLHVSQISLPEPCRRIVVLNRTTMVALSENRNLYLNEQIKWRDVRSFHWRRPFLVALTSNNRLVMAKVEKKNKFVEILSRRVEPKSHLITIVGDQVLLEMDRGNIELITPRPFAAIKMTTELSKERYNDVFKFLRKQRINLNVLFDHDPATFLKNIPSIIESVRDPFYLTLLIMELEHANVAQRMFSWKYEDNVQVIPESDDKVKVVCEALLAAMEDVRSSKLILPTISALVRLNKLTSAAKYAVDNNEILFLLHLVDSRTIYEAVIASYDLGCALKIAEFSKMDPSDYLPFIKKLQNMEENLRKFNINDYLGKRQDALKYLSKCEQDSYFEECVKYMEKYKLYADGFQIFTSLLNSSIDKDDQTARVINARYIRIATLFADNLFAAKEFEEAAILYEKARMNDRALECYLQCGNWHAAISLIQCMHLNESDAKSLYSKLHHCLTLKRQHEDAAFIALIFLKDGCTATKDCLTARNYRKAVDAARTFGTLSIALPLLNPKLLEDARNYAADFQTHANTLQQYVERLDQLKSKENSQNSEENFEFSDRESCASSESSNTSVRSSRRSNVSVSSSAKRIRRRERKLWNLKPGNPREKPSLVNAVRELIRECDITFSDRIPDLVNALILTDEHEAARELHAKYQYFTKYTKQVIETVWNSNEVDEEGGFKDLLIKCPPEHSTTISNRNNLIKILSL